MRVAIFFVWMVGVVIGVPMVYVAGLVWHEVATLEAAAPRVVLDPAATRAALSGGAVAPASDAATAFPGARAATMAPYDDGTRVVLVDAGDATGAAAARQHYLTESGAALGASTRLVDRFASDSFTTAAGEHGRLVRADGTLVIVVGPTDDAVAARVAALRGRADVPSLAWALSAPLGAEMGPLVLRMLVPVGVWCLLAVPWFGRMASWAGTHRAAYGVVPVDAATLRQRLLSMNRTLPFAVTPGERPDELHVDWRYEDARLTPTLQAAGRRRVHRLVLRLDDARRVVRVQEHRATLDWSAGGATAAALAWHASRRITFFHYEHEAELGVGIAGGRVAITPQRSYTFDLAQLKAPVVATITQSGWEFRPVVSFGRLLGG